MIVTRAPMRISFVGGGTDLADFYKRYPGRVISTAIDKFVHIAVNRTPLVDKVSARYSVTETVDRAEDIKHTRIKAALTDLGIGTGLEIGSFAMLPASTGLGSSSTFSVALIKALYTYQGKKIDRHMAAELASRLEIELLNEPIGKQDQYAAAFGGFNIFQFNADGSVDVKPVLMGYETRLGLEDHVLLFYTGITRPASSVLTEQKSNIDKKFETLKQMSDSVPEFEARLLKSDFKGLGEMLHKGWMQKKTLASNVSNNAIDTLYEAGMNAGAWGGKVLGAGGGGCVMFLAPIEQKHAIRNAVLTAGHVSGMDSLKEIPVKFVQSGVEILHNSDHNGTSFV
jgi:D-glycero-alpha-D-manno-heptose-7-phosphate kinase